MAANDALDFAVYLAYRFSGWFLGLFPLAGVFRFGQVAGAIAYVLLRSYRRLACENIRIAFPDWSSHEVERCARRHFMDLGANLLSALVLMGKPWETVQKYLDLTNLERIQERMNRVGSVVWAINHIGNWELFVYTVRIVRPGTHGVVYRALSNRFIDAHVRRVRRSTGLKLIERQHGLAQCTNLLKSGGMLAVLVDQHAGDKGIWTPFFDRLASTTPLPAILAKKTGAQLLPVAIFTAGPARWRLEVGDFIPQKGASTEELMHRVNRALESLVIRRPSDWFWVHQRWKTPSPKFLLEGYKRGVCTPGDVSVLKPFRILIRSSNWLGDAVMSSEAVRRIKYGRPDCVLTILTQSKLADFWRLLPEVDEVLTFNPRDSVLRVGSKIRDRFDVAILLPNSPRVAIEAWLAGIPRRVGYSRCWRNGFVNQLVPEPKGPHPLSHQKKHYLRIAERIGADLTKALPEVVRWKSEPGLAGLCPGAEYGPAKRWLEFDAAACELSERLGLHWLIFGTAKERSISEKIAKRLGTHATDLTGRTALSELITQLRRCEVLLTNDTGTMHLAAFLGVPTVSIFGSTEPQLTGPIGNGHTILRHHVECSPCFLRECPLDFRCMKAVTVEEVVRAVAEKVTSTRQARGTRGLAGVPGTGGGSA
ncbi:MAG TPA: lipopolysaccharide heptosyltransferase II [Chthoniobacterales bacterium]|jgi:heptosyltransferase-2|nr:lipopolysaccharide heptosyltransferase II [Chthoniobacterales bacterium]